MPADFGRHCLHLVIPAIFMPDALPDEALPVYPGLGQTLSYAGLHILRLCYPEKAVAIKMGLLLLCSE